MKAMIELEELKTLIKETVKKAIKEVLEEERINIILASLPYVSEEEMKDIMKTYGKPPAKKEKAYTEEIEI